MKTYPPTSPSGLLDRRLARESRDLEPGEFDLDNSSTVNDHGSTWHPRRLQLRLSRRHGLRRSLWLPGDCSDFHQSGRGVSQPNTARGPTPDSPLEGSSCAVSSSAANSSAGSCAVDSCAGGSSAEVRHDGHNHCVASSFALGSAEWLVSWHGQRESFIASAHSLSDHF